MANEPVKPKMGMGGSNGGRSRRAGTAIVKASGKKARRAGAKAELRAFLRDERQQS